MPTTATRGLTVQPLQPIDIPAAVRVHLDAFPGFFLSALGPAFLRQLYLGFCSGDGFGYVVKDAEGALLGVVAGSSHPAGFFKRLLVKRWWAFSLAALPAVLRRPQVVPRVARALTYRGDTAEEAPGALLSTIAVSPAAQGQGVGALLLRAFCGEAAHRGADRVYLTTDREQNEAVNTFYQRQGFSLEDTFTTPEGRAMNRYLKAA